MAKTTAPPKHELQTIPQEVLLPIPQPPSSLDVPIPEAARIFMEEIEGDDATAKPAGLPIISINHKEGGFKLPTGQLVPEVSGWPLFVFQTRKWYKAAFSPSSKGKPPDCWSADMISPHSSSLEMQAEDCAQCPQSQFGTGRDGRSQACGVFTWTFLLNPDFGAPPIAALISPPSSIRVLMGTRFEAGYFAQARSLAGRYEIVFTTFRLKPGGDLHCILDPVMGPICNDMAMVKKIAVIRNQFLQLMEGLRMRTPDIKGAQEGGGE